MILLQTKSIAVAKITFFIFPPFGFTTFSFFDLKTKAVIFVQFEGHLLPKSKYLKFNEKFTMQNDKYTTKDAKILTD